MPSSPSPSSSSRPRDAAVPVRPQAVVPLVLIVGLQALILAAGAVSMIWALMTGEVWSVPGAIFLLAVFGGGSLWLGNAARGLWRGRRWPRAAAFTAQLFSLVAAGTIVAPFSQLGAVGLALVAVVAMVCLFLPSVVDWTTQGVGSEHR